MQIRTIGEQASQVGSPDTFTGRVRMENRFAFPAPGRTAAAIVTFEPGARTAWHAHPLGQFLFVSMGEGWVQAEGQAKRTVRAGDTVFFEAGERHWHGATDARAMSHVAIQESQDGSPVTWLEHVSDADHLA